MIDDKDRKIIDLLLVSGREPATSLAEKVGLYSDPSAGTLTVNSLPQLYGILEDKDNIYCILASLGEIVINLAELGNDIALSIIQEGTRCVSDYIIDLVEKLGINKKNLVLAINGSIINNSFYRKLLEESLIFNFENIKWVSSILPPAYGAGLIAANYFGIDISLNNIVTKIKN